MARLWTSVVASAGAEAYAMPTHTADGLSVRGRQVLQVIAERNATEAIAVRFGHRGEIRDTTSLVSYAIRNGVGVVLHPEIPDAVLRL